VLTARSRSFYYEEISVAIMLSGGEFGALVLSDALIRLIPSVLVMKLQR
jgi:tRNA G37 N-methylase TrmD